MVLLRFDPRFVVEQDKVRQMPYEHAHVLSLWREMEKISNGQPHKRHSTPINRAILPCVLA